MSSERVLDLIMASLDDIKKDIKSVKNKQDEQDKVISELSSRPASSPTYNGKSIEQLLAGINKGSAEELSKINRDLDYTVGLLIEYGKKVDDRRR